MTGVSLQYDLREIDRVNRYLQQVGDMDQRDLLDIVGSTVESQTRRRIEDQEGAPDGSDWTAWSEAYAKTRHAHHGILLGEGDLFDSLGYVPGSDSVEIGTNMIYAATHQFGDDDRGIPARPYLGLSDDDERELEGVVNEYLEGLTAI